MENQELEIILTDEFGAEVERNIHRSPEEVALDRRVPNARLVASQVKYLQRARRKLPTYYAHRAILPSLAFEQSSSEECAAHKRHSGHTAIDLTAGLGVDTLYLSRRFERVVSVEQNPTLAAITRHNLALMGATNVELICGPSEQVVEELTEVVDLIYADPDRRSAEGKKLVLLEECSPNIAALLPLLKTKTKHIAVKLSPLFDLTEARRAFGPTADLEVISLGGEVKEVMVYLSTEAQSGGSITATALGASSFTLPTSEVGTSAPKAPFVPEEYSHIVVPDASLRKAGLVAEWCRSEGLEHHGAYGFARTEPSCTMGRSYKIVAAHPYQPRKLKPLVGRRLELIRHGFPLSSAAICKALGAKEGAGERWAFGEINGALWAFEIQNSEFKIQNCGANSDL